MFGFIKICLFSEATCIENAIFKFIKWALEQFTQAMYRLARSAIQQVYTVSL